MASYLMNFQDGILTVNFGEPAQNDKIVKDAVIRLEEIIKNNELTGGPVLKINGPASLPVAFVIAHKVAHLFGSIAVYDPKMEKYIVTITHDPAYKVGDVIS